MEGPIRKIAAMPIMASSAGPRPKREWSCVDFERVGLMMDGWCGDDESGCNTLWSGGHLQPPKDDEDIAIDENGNRREIEDG